VTSVVFVDFSTFLPDILAAIIAGAVVLFVAYIVVEPKLGLLDAKRRRDESEVQRQMIRTAILKAVHREMEDSAARLQERVAALSKDEYPYPGFDLTGWPLVIQIAAFTALEEETITALTHSYNRMRTANQQLAFASDLNYGATAILVTHMTASAPDAPLMHEVVDCASAAYRIIFARTTTLCGSV
jgi:hypothetical protein